MGSIKPHALVLPFPVQGHINPMLQFSKRLASKGVKVTLVATTNSIQPPDNSIDIEYIPDGSDQTDQKKDAGLERFKSVASRVLPDLIEKLNGYGSCPVKLVVYDSILPWALDIAHELGLYGASFFTQSCAVSAIYYHTSRGSLEIGSLEGENVVLPSMPLMGVKDLPSFISDMDAYPALLRHVLDRFSNFAKANWLLFNSFDELECEAGVRVKVDGEGMIRREEIEICIREVMEGERGKELKRNAVRWKEFAKEAVDEGGSSDKHIDEFISELCVDE
ncbi:hypothetical protein RJ639_045462 [Escallonia herrerae]|uniref:Glycosyltransferase N-terminal domain-containing protein n=1 Tax=Escallonia herrerae TaxID=1293975 RepID=A0AA88W505_9ASTE|nr:hypothetical protein RJ639_045462 [Escallonia herrerae]